MKSHIRTNEFKNQSEWVLKEREITAKDFPDPVGAAVSVFPLENHTLTLTCYFICLWGKKNTFSEAKSKSRERETPLPPLQRFLIS